MRMAGCSFGVVGRFGLLAVAALVAGCGGGGDLGAMSGRQVIEGRDIKDLFFWRARTLAFTRDTADTSQPAPQDFMVWSIDEPSPSMALAGVDWGYPYSWPVWFTGDVLVTGFDYERVYSIETHAAANLISDFPAPGGDVEPPDDTFRARYATIAVRSDGHAVAKLRRGDPTSIVIGRPPELRMFTLPAGISVGGMTFIGVDLALLTLRTPAVEGGALAIGRVGISRLDTTTGELTPMVPETNAPEWTGITGFCEYVTPSTTCGFLGTIGCSLDEPACPNGNPPPCMLLYAKADPEANNKVAAYLQNQATGSIIRLAGDGVEQFHSNRNHHLFAWGSSTDISSPFIRYWDYCGAKMPVCPFRPGRFISWRPDGGAFATYDTDDFMTIVDVANETCIAPDPNKTYSMFQAQWSPAGDRLMWVSVGDLEGTSETLWVGDRDGGSAVALSGGPSLSGTFSPDGQRIYVSHDGESTRSLGWIDLAAAQPTEQVLSSNRSTVALLDSKRALFIDHFNAQDGNGELVLVDLATGARQSLARAVTDVTVSRGSQDSELDVAYTVRGRAAASRDGLWLTTLPP